MATRKRGFKLHSIIEKLSEQCERKSPIPDEDGEDTFSSEVSVVKRKQRKGNGVKRVYKEASSRSDSEEGLSDEEVDILSIDEENQKDNVKLMKELAWKIDTGRKAGAYPRAAKRNALKTQTMKQKCDTKTSENKIKKQTKERHAKLEVNCSNKESHSSTSDGDLAINVEAFVNHAPIVEDVDQASSSCPVCSVLCDDVVQHIKDFHDSECAVVDHSDRDEELSDSSYSPQDATDSDEDFTPYKKTKAKTKNKKATKLQKEQNKKEDNESSENELCIDVENVIKTDSGVNDIDGPSVQPSTATVELSCLTCSLNFKTKDELTSHAAKCNKQESSQDKPKFCCGCKGCGMRFYHWEELTKHFEEKPDCRKLYQCDECGQICLTTRFLRKHKRIHSTERPHKCSVCDADFKDKTYLKRHSVTHTGVKEFKCDVCDKMFAHKRTLKEHRMRHTGERPHKCEYCDATFINSTSLKTHTTKHTGILPHKCEVCGKLFAKSYGLKIHSFSHSKEKPFVCEVCGKGFKRPDHFKQHKIIHSDNKPFKCDTCQRTFNQKVCLRKHLPCKEHEKLQKKLQNSIAKQTKAQNKSQGPRKSSAGHRKSAGASDREGISQKCDESRSGKDTGTAAASDCCDVSNDVSLASSIGNSPSGGGSLLAGCYSPPSFVRPTSRLTDNEYYTEHPESHVEYPHVRDMSSLLILPAHAMFSVEEHLSLDTLPPLSSHDTHALPGRPLSHDSSTDLGSVLLSSTMDPVNLSSIVEETSSFFGHH